MAIKSKEELKQHFRNGKPVSQEHFADLIDSMLNKRDDRFFGIWRKGLVYQKGDVVIYDGAMWRLTFGGEEGQFKICAVNPPPDGDLWELLIVFADDKDWKLVEETGEMYNQNEGNIGIGTDKPSAKLEITSGKKGSFLFIPDEKADPAFSIVNLDPRCDKNYLASGVGVENAVFVTDAPKGFLFKKGDEYGYWCAEKDINHGKLLMVLMADEKDLPRLGLGTDAPKAMLDITDGEKGRFMFSPEHKADPAFTIVNLDEEAEQNYLASGVGEKMAVFVSDAPEGIAFKKGGEYGEFCNAKNINQGDLLLLMRQSGKGFPQVGIGTADPQAMLDITDGNKGQLLFNPESKKDPALGIVNLDPACNKNYLNMGVGLTYASIVTDAQGGLVVKKGEEYEKYSNETELDQGRELLLIREGEGQPAQVGIGTMEPEAALQAEDGQGNTAKVLPENASGALISLQVTPEEAPVETMKEMNLGEDALDAYYFTTGLQQQKTHFLSSAPKGFLFSQGDESAPHEAGAGTSLVSITPEGSVGIGTETPYTKLDVTNNESGHFKFNLDKKVNPCLAIVNLRPGTKRNYLTAGVGNNRAIWVSDAPFGFAFKKGKEAAPEDQDTELDINQGETLMAIVPEKKGRVGIGQMPDDYELDVNGKTRAYSNYLSTDETKMDVLGNLENVLDKVMKLRGKRFSWKGETGCKDEGENLGFLAHDVNDFFPELIKTNRDGSLAMEYGKFTAVLLEAIREQQGMIATRDDKIKELENEMKQLKEQWKDYEKERKRLEKDLEDCQTKFEDRLAALERKMGEA